MQFLYPKVVTFTELLNFVCQSCDSYQFDIPTIGKHVVYHRLVNYLQ